MSSGATQPPRGIPILSGPPPVVESSACRQCGRDFNPLWRRGKNCGHCGYEYCSTCIDDGQALMPRRNGASQRPRGGADGVFSEIRDAFMGPSETAAAPGYDVEPVCFHCLAMLQVTAAPLDMLRSLPIKRLKEYLTAYDIKTVALKEKEDVVQAAFRARNPNTGCLAPEHESFYRRRSVPKLGQPVPPPGHSQQQQQRQRPPPQQQQQNANGRRPPPPTYAQRGQQPQSQQQNRPPPPAQARPQAQQTRPQAQQTRPPPATGSRATPAPAPKPAPRAPPPPVPTIHSLVALPNSYLASLSIGTLKAILFQNHVQVDFKQVLEKEELISRVNELVVDERKRLERQRVTEEREAEEARLAAEAKKAKELAAARAAEAEASGNGNGSGDGAAGASGTPGTPSDGLGGDGTPTNPSPQPPSPLPAAERPPPTGPQPDMDRGLCVVCQDEEATLAVVDCGHLAMCQHCSDLIMATSRECPLCRTRIVTPQRLIRIYRV